MMLEPPPQSTRQSLALVLVLKGHQLQEAKTVLITATMTMTTEECGETSNTPGEVLA